MVWRQKDADEEDKRPLHKTVLKLPGGVFRAPKLRSPSKLQKENKFGPMQFDRENKEIL